MLKGFKQFMMRGNVLDLAVAVVIGAAFGAVVTSFVTNILTPLIAAIVGKPDFSALNFFINGAVISYGIFLNALISFLLVAAAV
jgi:large conductance mechanosensitive channel